MTADRELLEAAAKAADIPILYGKFQNFPIIKTGLEVDGDPIVPWNPLTDDGDALRLAVKLRIDIGWVVDQVAANNCCEAQVDPYAATRRAIARAAAEIGGKP